jgi:predicted Zn-dependent protease with MMP-like domain
MLEMTRERFVDLVAEALDELPEPFASHLENVDVVVEDEPTADDLARTGVASGGTLYGLYQGVPQTERGTGYTFVLPDKITIFRGPILRSCNDEDEAYDQIAETVVHEVAHHFGISDERLDELGW